MENFICTTCGNEFAAAERPPAACPICEDERQYVNPLGQSWTTLAEMAATYRNVLAPVEPGLTEIVTEPKFGIGQRALLVKAPGGNILWDCVSHLDEATVTAVKALGGLSALAISHPHMFGSMVTWSHAFGNPLIYLHADYRGWVQRPDPVIQFWEGDSFGLDEGITLYRCGGHFEGSTVLHWAEGAKGRGALFTSDTIHVSADRRHVSFMYSYPNHIPLSAAAVDRIVATVMPLPFDRMHSHFRFLTIEKEGKAALQRSAERYKRAIGAVS